MRKKHTIAAALAAVGGALLVLYRRRPPAPTPAPAQPGSPSKKAATKWQRLTSPVTLQPGHAYAAVIQLSGLETLASDGTLADKLRELGTWNDLRVWSDPSETPADFPGTRIDAGGRRWASGTYAGRARSAQLPSQLAELWGSV
jgi:hypothetical protein